MVTVESLRTYLADKREDIEGITVRSREMTLEGTKEFVTSVYGPRRAGKSYLFYSLFNGSNDILYLNFDDIQLNDWTAEDFVKAVTLYEEAFRSEPSYVLLDEVQRVQGWEKAVITLYERKRYRIMLTGSSSRLLAKEIASSLRGRTLSHILLPLSYKEYLDFKGYEYQDLSSTTRKKIELRTNLEDYLSKGSFPGILSYPGPPSKFYEDYIDLVLYRDLVERYGVSNTGILRFLQKAIIASQSKELSVNKLFNTWRSMRYEATKRTFYEYFEYLTEAMFALPLYKYDRSDRTSYLTTPKVYLPDPAMGSVLGGHQIGRSMENCVYLHLVRRQQREGGSKLYFWKDRDREVDFVVVKGDGITDLIQVTHSMEGDTLSREIKGFDGLARSSYKDCSKTIITWTGEEEAPEGIEVVPLWKFLLEVQGKNS